MSYKIKAILCLSMILPCFLLGSCGSDTQPAASSDADTQPAVSSDAGSSEEDKTVHLKKAYELLCDAAVTMENISDVIETAWHYAIYEDNPNVSELAYKTGLSEQDLINAGASDYNLDDLFTGVDCCMSVMRTDDSYYKSAKDNIEEAKKEIRSATDDLNHYEDMRNFYTTSLSYYEWLEKATGSYKEATALIDDYETKLREFKNDMDLDFG
ncbi:MAG: hypothetical protein IJ060_10975 [Oscillospiraceae bacterium]|nr:hypothetical protein [Oscillospiraceae bacterium]